MGCGKSLFRRGWHLSATALTEARIISRAAFRHSGREKKKKLQDVRDRKDRTSLCPSVISARGAIDMPALLGFEPFLFLPFKALQRGRASCSCA